MIRNNRPIRTAPLLAAALLAATALTAPGLAWAKVGVTSTTNGEPIGKPPQMPQRVLRVGIDIFANERITTGPEDQAHVLFVDGSALTVGPNSDLVIDKFVYDPEKETGSLAINATKGVFRLVGGKITKGDDAKMRVGVATIGIRGGITIVNANDPANVNTFFMFGQELTVTTPLGSETARRPGSEISIRPGQPPSSPHLVETQTLQKLLGLLEGAEGGRRAFTVKAGTIEQGASQLAGVTGDAKNQDNNQNNNTGDVTGQVGDTPRTPLPGINTEGRMVRNVPYTGFDPQTLAAPRNAPNNQPLASAVLGSGTVTLVTGDSQTLSLPYDPGNVVTVTNASTSFGAVSGTGFSTADNTFYAYALIEPNNANNLVTIAGGAVTPPGNFPISGFGQHEVVALNAAAPFLPSGADGPAIANASFSPLY